MFGPGVNKPTNTKMNSGKNSEIMTPQEKNPKFVHCLS
jgi:hypothetical protein|tara:strand:- start:434 stop:547 length:114 start_codon:yes stop_codon:yes gene_type:complete